MSFVELSERLKTNFQRVVTARKTNEEGVHNFVLDLIGKEKGLVFGETHGLYATPKFLSSMMGHFAKCGVQRLYVEMIPASRQLDLDLWQIGDDDTAIVNYFNGFRKARALLEWTHNWDVLKSARKAGIRIVAIEKIPDFCFSMDQAMKDRTENMLNIIVNDMKDLNPDGKIIVYTGTDHVQIPKYSLSQKLGIPGLKMEEGPHSVGVRSLSKKRYDIYLPRDPSQDPHFGVPCVRSRRIVSETATIQP